MKTCSVIASAAKQSHKNFLRDCFVTSFLAMTFSFALCLLPAANSFSQGVWTQKADFGGAARGDAVGFSIGTKGYIGLGASASYPYTKYQDFWEWDEATNVWTQKANFFSGRYGATGFSLGSKGYIGLGYNGSNCYQDFWEWDQTANTWTQKANFTGIARFYAVGFSIDKKGYIGTGNANSGIFYNDMWEWNGDTASLGYNTWTQKANFGGAGRFQAVGFSIGKKGYLGTGYNGNNGPVFNDFWEWNQATNAWTQKANFGGMQRSRSAGFSIYDKGYIGTGGTGYSSFNDFWEYDTTANSWAQKANFGGNYRYGAVGFSIGNKGYIGTGNDGYWEKDFWEYNPNANGVNEIDLENLISVYPNPSKGKINLTISQFEDLKMKGMEIYNTRGEKVYSKEAVNFQINSSSNFQIDLSTQPNGIYFIHLSTDKGNVTKRIILSY